MSNRPDPQAAVNQQGHYAGAVTRLAASRSALTTAERLN